MGRKCIYLINSRNEAKLLQASDDCLVKENGRKIDIVELTLKCWSEKGRGKSAQNLREKLAYWRKLAKRTQRGYMMVLIKLMKDVGNLTVQS